MWTRTLIAGGVWIALAATAIAQDDIANFFASGSFELRAGPMYHGLEADDRLMDTLAQQRLEDINVELIWTPPPNDVLFWLGSPRAAIGATLNLRGFEHNFARSCDHGQNQSPPTTTQPRACQSHGRAE